MRVILFGQVICTKGTGVVVGVVVVAGGKVVTVVVRGIVVAGGLVKYVVGKGGEVTGPGRFVRATGEST
jgi:hypothetical protein